MFNILGREMPKPEKKSNLGSTSFWLGFLSFLPILLTFLIFVIFGFHEGTEGVGVLLSCCFGFFGPFMSLAAVLFGAFSFVSMFGAGFNKRQAILAFFGVLFGLFNGFLIYLNTL